MLGVNKNKLRLFEILPNFRYLNILLFRNSNHLLYELFITYTYIMSVCTLETRHQSVFLDVLLGLKDLLPAAV